MIPNFNSDGLLPLGIHSATWEEFYKKFNKNSHRKKLLKGLKNALENLKRAGCKIVYINGSFVTSKEYPEDFDGCWEIDNSVDPLKIDKVLLNFSNKRNTQKAKYSGELFPVQLKNSKSGKTFLDFFQYDKEGGKPKGIVKILLRSL